MSWTDEDDGLTAEQLDCKYNLDGDGEHPIYTREQWRSVVFDERTLLGYWAWLEMTIEDLNV